LIIKCGEFVTSKIKVNRKSVSEYRNKYKNLNMKRSIRSVRLISAIIFTTFMMLTSHDLYAQQTISGTIKDLKGIPLPGVTIREKGKSNAAKSDDTGSFKINVSGNEAILSFSLLGFKLKEQSLMAGKPLNILLEEDAADLSEVVVVGYGSQRKSDLTGAISSVKGSDLTKLSTQKVDQALQGRAAGVSVQSTDGAAPGADAIVRVRGSNSLQGGNEALIVVDGVQGITLGQINPNDIESMEILKDASSTAIYGARGANGVVLITTKRGKTGKPKINYVGDGSIASVSKRIDLLSAGEYAENINKFKLSQNGGGINPVAVFSPEEIAAYYASRGTDWQDQIFRKAKVQNHQLSISGASDISDYFVSLGYLDQDGVLKNTDYKRLSVRTNVNTNISKFLKGGAGWSMAKEDGSKSLYGGGADWGNNPIGSALSFAPTVSPYDANGGYSVYPPYGQQGYWNPLANTLEPYIQNNTLTNNVNAYLEAKVLDGLTFRVTGSGIFRNVNDMSFYNLDTQNGYGSSGAGTAATNRTQTFQNSNILSYDKFFGDHHLTLTGVAEQQTEKYIGFAVNGSKFTVQQTGIYDLSGAQTLTSSSVTTKRSLNSFLARANYGYKDKYLLTASLRRDGSSVFGKNNKWGNFPAAAFSWNLMNEDFLKNVEMVSRLKFRASWGITGNQGINPYETLAKITGGQNYPYNGSESTDLGYTLSTAANPDLKWEKTEQKNIGLDLGLFENKITITADVYSKMTKDLLMYRQLPTYVGISSILDNVGSMRNQGLELNVQATPVNKAIVWNTGINFSLNKTKIVSLGASDSISVASSNGHGGATEGLPLSMLVEGKPLGTMYGFVTLGTWGSNQREEAAKYGQLPGDQRYKDVNNDGLININDRTIIGNAFPKFTFGWNNDVSYKDFNLSFQFVGSVGNDVFNLARYSIEGYQDATGANLKNAWTPENQDTDVPAIIDVATRDAAGLATKVSFPSSTSGLISRWVEDASFVRLQYVTLTYSFKKMLKNTKIADLSVHGSVSNVFTITKYQGYNPEVASWTGNDAQIGSDYNSYPASRVFSLGVNLSF
jgi:TonB-linked SusC/RagA family outer membrane protein